MNAVKPSKSLELLYAKYFNERPELREFCEAYCLLQHGIDDIVDEVKDTQRTIDTFSLARRLWTSPVYLKWRPILDMVDELCNVQFLVSEKWKDSAEEWKRIQSDVLRHTGYNIFFAIIYLEVGRSALHEIAEHMIEYSHHKHLADYEGLYSKVNVEAA